jgi:hypothetical protein
MPTVEFTITIGGMRRKEVEALAERIQEKADHLFEDATMDHGRPMTMLVGENKWAKVRR